MRPDEFPEIFRIQPFVPMRIHLSNGTAYDIRHPDQIPVKRSRLDIGVDRCEGLLERTDYVSLLHVVSVTPMLDERPRTTTVTGNQN